MRLQKRQALLASGLFLLAMVTGQTGLNEGPGRAQEKPAWWQIILHLEAEGEYGLESGDRSSTGHYTFALRWRGLMERDEDDYLIYSLEDELQQWTASETTFTADAATRATTTDFRDRPSLAFRYIIRRAGQLHLDFLVTGIVVPQAESEDSFVLLFPSSAENNQRDQQISYNQHVTKGSNRITLEEREMYADRVDRTYSWGWENRSWTLKPNRTVLVRHAHSVIVRLSVVPRSTQSK